MSKASSTAITIAALSIAAIFAYVLPDIKRPSWLEPDNATVSVELTTDESGFGELYPGNSYIDLASYTTFTISLNNSLYDGSQVDSRTILLDSVDGKPATVKVHRGFIN